MQIKIFDVAHGFCAAIVTDEGHVWLMDCGDNPKGGFSPATYLNQIGCRSVDRLFVLNYDEDHLSGLPDLLLSSSPTVGRLHVNRSITPDQLEALKKAGGLLGFGMLSLLMGRDAGWKTRRKPLAAHGPAGDTGAKGGSQHEQAELVCCR